jgi:hypothetical protein
MELPLILLTVATPVVAITGVCSRDMDRGYAHRQRVEVPVRGIDRVRYSRVPRVLPLFFLPVDGASDSNARNVDDRRTSDADPKPDAGEPWAWRAGFHLIAGVGLSSREVRMMPKRFCGIVTLLNLLAAPLYISVFSLILPVRDIIRPSRLESVLPLVGGAILICLLFFAWRRNVLLGAIAQVAVFASLIAAGFWRRETPTHGVSLSRHDLIAIWPAIVVLAACGGALAVAVIVAVRASRTCVRPQQSNRHGRS